VIEAKVATREEMKELVLVLLVEVNPTKLPFVAEKFVVKKFVELLLSAEMLVDLIFVEVALIAIRLVV
jgi:hypothetical protein